MDSTLTGESSVGPQVTDDKAAARAFDREKLILYVASPLIVLMVLGVYVSGHVLPGFTSAQAIVNAARADKQLSAGCFLLFWEHSFRVYTAYSLRFLAMMIGSMLAFMGMLFSIKGVEASYRLGLKTGSGSASLRTASPGLVLCTLGVALCAATVLVPASFTFSMIASCVR